MGMCVDCDKLKCEVCLSMGRHPAGRSVESPEELGWALATAGRLGEERERERIIKLLEEHLPLLETKDASERDLLAFSYAIRLFRGQVIALIKGESK